MQYSSQQGLFFPCSFIESAVRDLQVRGCDSWKTSDSCWRHFINGEGRSSWHYPSEEVGWGVQLYHWQIFGPSNQVNTIYIVVIECEICLISMIIFIIEESHNQTTGSWGFTGYTTALSISYSNYLSALFSLYVHTVTSELVYWRDVDCPPIPYQEPCCFKWTNASAYAG